MVVAQERLRAVARPFYGTSQTARRPCHQREFGIRVIARTEIAANVLRDDAYLGRLQAQHMREIHFWTNDPATTRIKGNSAGIRFICRQSRSDLHGYAGNARYLRLNPDDVSCPVERLASGSRVTDVRIERDVRIHIRPDARRAGLGCVAAFGGGR